MGDRGREAGGLVPAVRRSRELGSKCGEGERGQGRGEHVGGSEGADWSEGDGEAGRGARTGWMEGERNARRGGRV